MPHQVADIVKILNNKQAKPAQIVEDLFKEPNTHDVLVTTYKSLRNQPGLISIWNALLDKGISIQQPAQSKMPLLVELISYGYNIDAFVQAIESLLKKHGESIVNLADDKGTTPLMAAVEHGNATVTTLLMKYGALPQLRNNNNQTAKDIAVESKNTCEYGDNTSFDVVIKLLK